MATTVYTNNQYYTDIATAIRNKNGTNNTYTPAEMAAAINALVISGSAISLQNKTVTPSENTQSITYDLGYNGLGTVTVDPIPSSYLIPTGNKSISANGTGIDVAQYATVSVTVPTGSTISNQDKTVNPTTSEQTITADSGYTGLGTVTVTAVSRMTLPTAASASSLGTSKATIGRSTSAQYINIPTGYNSTAAYYTINAIENGTQGTPIATKGSVSNHSISVTPSVTNSSGYITGSTLTGTAVTVSASELVSGNKAIAANGTDIDVTNYATVSVSVSGSSVNNQSKSVSPTESLQVVTPDSGYTGLSQVSVGAISNTYVGSGVARRTSSNLSVFGATVTAPAGYYATAASKTIESGVAGTPVATKGTVTNHSITVTPSVSNTAGYISDADLTGTAVTVTAAELVSGNKSITQNGTNIDVTDYATVSVNVSGGGDNLAIAVNDTTDSHGGTIRQITGVSLLGDTVTAATLLSGVTAHAQDGTALVGEYVAPTPKTASDVSVNGATVTIPAGAYASQIQKSVTSGSVTAPATISGSSATVSTGTNTLTLSKTVSVTPSVTTAGYVSSGTAENSSVSLTASVTTQGAQTIHPSTSDQTITGSKYLTGTQTIKAVTTTNLTADNIKSGVTVQIGDSTDSDCVTSVTGTYAGSGGGTSKNVQVVQSTTRINQSALTKASGEITVATTGTYDIYWSAMRSNTSTSYTWGSQLYIGSTGYGTENTTWSNNVQNNHLTNVSLTANQKVSVYTRGRTGSYYTYCPTLLIIEQ